MYRIMCVCTGNICRSPVAEVLLRTQAQLAGIDNHIEVCSTGIQRYHVGEPPDIRAEATCGRHHISMRGMVARQFTIEDYERCDLILAMDMSHYKQLQLHRPRDARADIELFLEYADYPGKFEVDDPYYGTHDDFEAMFILLEAASRRIIKKIKQQLFALV